MLSKKGGEDRLGEKFEALDDAVAGLLPGVVARLERCGGDFAQFQGRRGGRWVAVDAVAILGVGRHRGSVEGLKAPGEAQIWVDVEILLKLGRGCWVGEEGGQHGGEADAGAGEDAHGVVGNGWLGAGGEVVDVAFEETEGGIGVDGLELVDGGDEVGRGWRGGEAVLLTRQLLGSGLAVGGDDDGEIYGAFLLGAQGWRGCGGWERE